MSSLLQFEVQSVWICLKEKLAKNIEFSLDKVQLVFILVDIKLSYTYLDIIFIPSDDGKRVAWNLTEQTYGLINGYRFIRHFVLISNLRRNCNQRYTINIYRHCMMLGFTLKKNIYSQPFWLHDFHSERHFTFVSDICTISPQTLEVCTNLQERANGSMHKREEYSTAKTKKVILKFKMSSHQYLLINHY